MSIAPAESNIIYNQVSDSNFETLMNAAKKEAAASLNLKHTAESEDGVIHVKYQELISVVVEQSAR